MKRFLTFVTSVCILLSAFSFCATADDATMPTIDYATIYSTTVNNVDMVTIDKNAVVDGKNVIAISPKTNLSTIISLDSFGVGSKLAVDIREYKYLSVEYKYVSESHVSTDKNMRFRILKSGGVLTSSVYTTSDNKIKENEWDTMYFNFGKNIASLIPDDSNGIIKQIHFEPFGTVRTDLMSENDVMYIGSFTFHKTNPNDNLRINVEFAKDKLDVRGAMSPMSIKCGDSYTLPESEFELNDYVFSGWLSSADNKVYDAGTAVLAQEENVKYKPVWVKDPASKTPSKTKTLHFANHVTGMCNGSKAGVCETIEENGREIVKVTATPSVAKEAITVDSLAYTTVGINLYDYNYMTLGYRYVPSAEPSNSNIVMRILKQQTFAKSVYFTAESQTKVGEWSFAVFDISSMKDLFVAGKEPIVGQIHILPYGTKSADESGVKENDVMYFSTISFTEQKPIISTHSSYMTGYTDGTFKPSKTMSRAEACTVVARVLSPEEEIVGTPSFEDVSADKWYAKYIGFCESKGLLKAYSKLFEPEKAITRAEFAELVFNTSLVDKADKEMHFSDVTEAHPKYSSIMAAASANLITGYNNGEFMPDKTITRAEVVTVVNRALGRSVAKEKLSSDVAYTFLDVSPASWAFAEIAEATVSHHDAGQSGWLASIDSHEKLIASAKPSLEAGEKKLAEIDLLANKMKNAIRSTESDYSTITGTKYYVSLDGSDDNDGLSPEKAIKTLDKVNTLALNSGDGVLFRRGDIFRGAIKAMSGVTYSAYGEGAKPRLYRSPENGADPDKWTLMEGTDNIWVYENEDMVDVGVIVFNEGKEYTTKEIPDYKNNAFYVRGTDTLFDIATELDKDLEMFHKADSNTPDGGRPSRSRNSTGKIYLRCDRGNPGSVFESIEFAQGNSTITVSANNVTLDNLCVMYSGSHGVAGGTLKGLTVKNCEFSWIGGSVQHYNETTPQKAGTVTRYGNAIEIYGGCDGYTVENNYISQCYDTGITHQYNTYSSDVHMMNNILYKGNLIENCNYSIEYFINAPSDDPQILCGRNILFEGNVLRLAGSGFCEQRPNPGAQAHIQSMNASNGFENFVIRGNILDRSTGAMMNIVASHPLYLPKMEQNTFLQTYGEKGFVYGASKVKSFDFTALMNVKFYSGDEKSEVFFVG